MRKLSLILLFLVYLTNSYCQYLHSLNEDLPCINKKYHLAIHVVKDSNDWMVPMIDITNAIDSANSAFKPICISFEICTIDTILDYNFCEITIEQIKDLSTQYSYQNRINLYFITRYLMGKFTYGYCSGSVLSGKAADIILLNPKELSHELGHYFGLLDTYLNQDELVNGSNCETAGDKICDTPADPYVQQTYLNPYINNCIFHYLKKDLNEEFYQPDVGNLMSYYKCRVGFTKEQYLKMAENYYLAKYKLW